MAMDNNAQTATPVNLIAYEGTDPIPVTATPDFPVIHQRLSGGVLQVQMLISAVACELDCVAGYNSDPTPGNLLYVQLHNAIGVIAPGAVPAVVIPVYGGKTPYSLAMNLRFPTGLVLALSTTELTFTAAASPWLAYSVTYRTVT